MRIDNEIAAKQAELDELVKHRAALAEFTQVKRVAIDLHDALCRSNHDDGCGWGWEIAPAPFGHNWQGWAHKRWLDHAERVIEKFPHLTSDEFIELAEFFRSLY